MKISDLVVIAFLLLSVISCNNKDFTVSAVKVMTTDFEGESATTWTGGVAGYPSKVSKEDIKLSVLIDTLPSGLDTTAYGLHVYSRNLSDTLFTFIKTQLGGLARNTSYALAYEIELATNYPENAAAGNAVYLKAGGSVSEPTVNASRKFSLDKGIAASGGKDMVLLGNVSNELLRPVYAIAPKTNAGKELFITSDNDGKMWLCIGIESLYLGATDLYFDKIKVTIRQR